MRSIAPALALFAAAVSGAHGQMPDKGRLLMTAGVSMIEGQAGSGLVPWGTIAGYGSDESWGGTAHYSRAETDDFSVESFGAALGWRNRIEVSYARMAFDTEDVGAALGLGAGYTIEQDVYGGKVRLAGDLIADQDSWMPQVTAGVQHKVNRRDDLVVALGAEEAEGTDYTLTATKLFLAQSVLANVTLRSTEANQFGFLGFSGERSVEVEASAAYLLSRRIAVGADYRSKPDEAFGGEDDAYDVFAAFFINKHASITAAYVDLGTIAGAEDQGGAYLSIQGSF